MELTLASDNEVENICLYMGDILPYDIDDLIRVEFIAALSASFPAACSAAFGLTSARNDAIDSIGEQTLFRVLGGAQTVFCESDDGTHDLDDKSTGQTLSTSFKRFAIDFSVGHQTRLPPSASLGGKADVRFFMGDANGLLRRVCESTLFDMSGYAGNLQLFAQLQKTAAASVATLSILEASVEYRLPSTVR